MVHKILIALCCFTTAGLPQSQTVGVEGRLSYEITFDSACERASGFLENLGFSAISIDRSKARIRRSSIGSHYSLFTKSGFWIKVDAKSGRIYSAHNMKRRNEQYKNQNRTGTSLFTSEASAKNRLRLVATQSGVPVQATLSSFGWKRDGEVKDANTSGAIWGNYKFQSEGFHLSLDPQDGMFISFQHLANP